MDPILKIQRQCGRGVRRLPPEPACSGDGVQARALEPLEQQPCRDVKAATET